MKIKYFYGKIPNEKYGWKMVTTDWLDFVEMLKVPQKQNIKFNEIREMRAKIKSISSKSSEKELKIKKELQDKIKLYKEKSAFMAGEFTGNRRTEDFQLSRTMLTLDVDEDWEILNKLDNISQYEYVLYSTFSHTPENPKVRIIFPLNPVITDRDEYPFFVKNFVKQNNFDIDHCSDKFNQYMFLPNIPMDGIFEFKYNKGEILNPCDYMQENVNIPMLNDNKRAKTNNITQNKGVKIKSPIGFKDGDLIGDFCKQFNINQTIDKWLSDIYNKENAYEYTYIDGSTDKGLKVYGDDLGNDSVFAYSFHNTDGLNDGKCHNSFDLLKIHKFKGDLEKTVEFAKMQLNSIQKEKINKFEFNELMNYPVINENIQLPDCVQEKYNIFSDEAKNLIKDLITKNKNFFDRAVLPLKENGNIIDLVLLSRSGADHYLKETVNNEIYNMEVLQKNKIFVVTRIIDKLILELNNIECLLIPSFKEKNFIEYIKSLSDMFGVNKEFLIFEKSLYNKLKDLKYVHEFNFLMFDNLYEFYCSKSEILEKFLINFFDYIDTTNTSNLDQLLNHETRDMLDFLSFIEDSENISNYRTDFLDSFLGAGLPEKGIIIIGGVPGAGKTTFAHQLVENVALHGTNVLFFSMENTKNELLGKTTSRYLKLEENYSLSHSKISRKRNIDEKNKFSDTDYEKLCIVHKWYTNYVSKYMTIIEGNYSIEEIENFVKLKKLELGDKPLIVLIDYLQKIIPDKTDTGIKETIDKSLNTFRKLTNLYNIPIMAISSFNRSYYGKSVELDAFKESGNIEYDANLIMSLEYTKLAEFDKETDIKKTEILDQIKSAQFKELTLKVLKEKNNSARKTKLKFDGKHCTFEVMTEFDEEKKQIPEFEEKIINIPDIIFNFQNINKDNKINAKKYDKSSKISIKIDVCEEISDKIISSYKTAFKALYDNFKTIEAKFKYNKTEQTLIFKSSEMNNNDFLSENFISDHTQTSNVTPINIFNNVNPNEL